MIFFLDAEISFLDSDFFLDAFFFRCEFSFLDAKCFFFRFFSKSKFSGKKIFNAKKENSTPKKSFSFSGTQYSLRTGQNRRQMAPKGPFDPPEALQATCERSSSRPVLGPCWKSSRSQDTQGKLGSNGPQRQQRAGDWSKQAPNGP